MTGNSELTDRLEVESWFGTNRLDEELFVLGFRFTGDELARHKLGRERAIPTVDGVVGHTWIWIEEDGETIISVTSLEAPSRLAAHESLVQALSNFQSPLVGRSEGQEVGDVAFGDGSTHWVVFARANLVFIVRNGGDELTDVGPAASLIDELIIRRDDLESVHEIAPTIEELGVYEAKDRGRRLAVRAVDPLERPVMLKLFSQGGRVERLDDELVFIPTTDDDGQMIVVGINPNGGATMRKIRVEGLAG